MGAEPAAEGREFPAQGVVTQRALDEAGDALVEEGYSAQAS
jgi:hypothetical protein